MVPQVADVPASHFASTPTIRESTMIVFSHLSFGGFTKRTPTGPRGELLVASRGDDVLRGGGDDIITVVRPHV